MGIKICKCGAENLPESIRCWKCGRMLGDCCDKLNSMEDKK